MLLALILQTLSPVRGAPIMASPIAVNPLQINVFPSVDFHGAKDAAKWKLQLVGQPMRVRGALSGVPIDVWELSDPSVGAWQHNWGELDPGAIGFDDSTGTMYRDFGEIVIDGSNPAFFHEWGHLVYYRVLTATEQSQWDPEAFAVAYSAIYGGGQIDLQTRLRVMSLFGPVPVTKG